MASKFIKAKAEQAKFKLGIYGNQGSGKTFTALLFAEYLAKRDGKRVAFIDTERGTDFYAMAIPERKVHPEAFDFDRLVTRSIMETLDAVQSIDPAEHSVLVIDSVTHLWEAARESYTGRRTTSGGIPIQAWGAIKKPYKQLMTAFLDSNFHAILCGREGLQMEKDDDGDMEIVGTKMKAEGETPYEPHILMRMHPARDREGGYTIQGFIEKDRSGILTGKTVLWPNGDTIAPILAYLSGEQGKVGSLEDAASKDSAAMETAAEKERADRTSLFEAIRAAIVSARSVNELGIAWDLTKGKKTKLGEKYDDLATLKDGRKAELVERAA